MATKKSEVLVAEEEVKEVKPAKAVKETEDPWKKKVEIRLPKPAPGAENFITASVNGKTFKIQKGIAVSVPAPIAEVLEHSLEAEDAAEMYVQSLAK